MTVEIVGIVTLVGAIAIWIIAWVVATRRPMAAIEDVRPGIYRTRRGYFIALTAVLVAALVMTLRHTPYASAQDEPTAVTLVANGVMWGWQIRSGQASPGGGSGIVLPVGRPVTFDVGSLDVNHGFGIYRPDGSLLAQAQAMPGYRNELTVTFPVAGTYRVFCLEYCGLGHHMMFASLEAR